MARFSFALINQSDGTKLSGETIRIRDALGGTIVASTADVGTGVTVTDNGDGTYHADNIPNNNLWIYVGSADALQNEGAGIPWDNGDGVTHASTTTGVHGATGNVLGEGDVDGVTIEVSGGNLQVKSGGIDTTQLANDAVTNAKIDAGAVDTTELASSSVETAKIADDNVTGAKLAPAVAGDGLEQDGSGNLGVDFDTDDFEIVSGELALKKSLSSQIYIADTMELMQMLSALDSSIDKLSDVSGIENACLFSGSDIDLSPSANFAEQTDLDIYTCQRTAYSHALAIPFTKQPNQNQLVVRCKAGVDNASGSGNIKVVVGGITLESDAITTVIVADIADGQEQAMYVDISTLSNYTTNYLSIQTKINNASYDLYMYYVSVWARSYLAYSGGTGTFHSQGGNISS